MKRLFCIFLLLSLLLCGCGKEDLTQETYFAMDTVMELKVWGKDSEEAVRQLKALISQLDSDWSTTSETSLLSRLNEDPDLELTEDQAALLEKAEYLSQYTGGCFDPKLRSLSQAWGFYQSENQSEDFTLPTDAQITAALAVKKWDLGAAMKGYAGQACADLLYTLNVERAMLVLGGNVQTFGSKADGTPWQIGIQNPDGGDTLGILAVTGTTSVVTSGDYQRYFEKDGVTYHHILDPQTGRPADSGLRSVTVICKDGMTADALSTALFVMGLDHATAFWRQNGGFEAVFVTTGGAIYATEGAALSGCEYEVISHEV